MATKDYKIELLFCWTNCSGSLRGAWHVPNKDSSVQGGLGRECVDIPAVTPALPVCLSLCWMEKLFFLFYLFFDAPHGNKFPNRTIIKVWYLTLMREMRNTQPLQVKEPFVYVCVCKSRVACIHACEQLQCERSIDNKQGKESKSDISPFVCVFARTQNNQTQWINNTTTTQSSLFQVYKLIRRGTTLQMVLSWHKTLCPLKETAVAVLHA